MPSGFLGITKRDMWKGMIGFDRPTWIPGPESEDDVLHHGPDMPETRLASGREVNALEGGLAATDKIRDWELLATLAASTFMGRGGTIVPLVFVAVDPVNQYNSEAGWKVDYFFTNEIIFTLFTELLLRPRLRRRGRETWGVGGLNKQRDETGIRLTYQF